MVDPASWDHLDAAAQREVQALLPAFQQALQGQGVSDGDEFRRHWAVQRIDGVWGICRGGMILPGITSLHRAVIETLFNDGVQNLNR